ncbi:MAG: sugar-binding protein, partial [Terrimicrobiaceae bacterium]
MKAKIAMPALSAAKGIRNLTRDIWAAGCLGAFLLAAPVSGVEILANYNVIPTETAPVIDGKLDEACWKAAETCNTYYKYLAQTPIKGDPETAFKMVYDSKGIYLGIINYEKFMDKIKAKAIARDDGNLWYDDCAEIYFDPYASSIGFTKFAVNSLGTQWDMRRIDTAIELASWSGNNWSAATSKTADAWTIEIFIPWSDLGREAREG